jgi:hypothetical protein
LEEEEKGLQRREIYRKEKRERSPGAAWWPISGCVGFLWWSWWQRGLEFAMAEREREREREREGGRNWEEADFVAYFGPSFLLPQGLKSTSIYRRWKWAILSTLGKNFNP